MKSSKSKVRVIIFIILASVAGGFYFYSQYSSGGISIEVKLPQDEVEVGFPFDVEVIFSNNTGNSLGDVRLVLNYPDNLVSADDGNNNIETNELGDIREGTVHRETFRVIATPSEDPDYKAKVSVFYSPASIAAEFKKTEEFEIEVKEPDFKIELEIPEQIFPGEELEAKVLYERDDEIAEGVELELRISHPEEFKVTSNDPEEVDIEKDGIKFANLNEDDEEGELIMRGRAENSHINDLEITASLVMRIFDKEYLFLSESKIVTIKPSSLSFQIVLGERAEVVIPGERIAYVLIYRNNTDIDLKDLTIKAQLIGEMFDINSIQTNAKFSSSNNTITWDHKDFEELKRLKAGESGQVAFAIDTLDKHPIRRLNDKDFTLIVDGRIESPTVPFAIEADGTVNTNRLESKVTGKIEVGASAYFRDAVSGIINGGAMPPRVGSPTNLTIHWNLTNYGTDVEDVEVRARLADGATFTGKTKSNTSNVPKLDPDTGEVVWRVGKLIATTGVLSEKPEAIFQIEVTPNSSNEGKYVSIVGTTEVVGNDEFTETIIKGEDSVLTTRLEDDPTVGENIGKVVQ